MFTTKPNFHERQEAIRTRYHDVLKIKNAGHRNHASKKKNQVYLLNVTY